MIQSTESFGLPIYKLSIVCTLVWEIQSTDAISLPLKPLAIVVEIFSQLEWRQEERSSFRV